MDDEGEPRILNKLFELWGISPTRDHPHHDPKNWIDEPPKNGMIRTHCKVCGEFVGYRPASSGSKRRRR